MLNYNLKSFLNIYFGWLHWWFVRSYSLLVIALILTLDVELSLGLIIFFLLHNNLGFEIIFEDYISKESSRQALDFFFRTITILCIRQCFLFFT